MIRHRGVGDDTVGSALYEPPEGETPTAGLEAVRRFHEECLDEARRAWRRLLSEVDLGSDVFACESRSG